MNDKFKNDKDFKQDLVEKRGFIISKAINIESKLDRFILHYFFQDNPDKAWEFHDDLLITLNSSNKISLLKKVIKRINKSNNQIDVDDLYDLLQKIFKLRNEVAHWRCSRVWNDGIHLRRERLKNPEIIGESAIDYFIKNCNEANIILNKIFDLINKSNN